MDWWFWVQYGVPLCIGLAGGWWLRGVQEDERRAESYRLMRELEQAKRRHPAFMEGRGWER